jgi:hypothetical protein
MTTQTAKPYLKLTGTDGNAFALLGAALKTAKAAKWTPEQIETFKKEATAGDYENLLQALTRHFDVA